MGLFGFSNSQPMNNIDRAREAMKYFHNEMVLKFSSYNFTLNQLITQVSTSQTGVAHEDIFLDSLGTAIVANEMSESQIADAMIKLADISNGRIPGNQAMFFKALSDRLQDISAGDWVGALPQIAADTALTAAKGVQEIGNAVIDTGKTLTMIGPALIVAAVIFIGLSYTKRIAGAGL